MSEAPINKNAIFPRKENQIMNSEIHSHPVLLLPNAFQVCAGPAENQLWNSA